MVNELVNSTKGMGNSIKRVLKNWIGLDRAIGFTILARFWQAFSGIVTLFLIARFLTPSQQGYYYTFYSIVALQIVFELGFSFVILQLAAHERAHLKFLPGGSIEGDPVSHSRLASVLQKAIYWYLAAGILMAAALIPVGLWFFKAHQSTGPAVAWRLPWCTLVIAAMLAFQIDPVFSFLEGCGFVAQVAERRFTQSIVGGILAWTGLVLHHGLYAPALLIVGQVGVGLAYLFSLRHRHLLSGLLRHRVGENSVGWRTEIWPFQWKIAVSWMCGYFAYQIFSPVLFAYQGAVVAGRMGMSLNVTTGIGSIAIAWMNTKASPFGALVARREFNQLDNLFFRTLKQSTILLVATAAFFLFAFVTYGHYVPRFASRLLPAWVVGLMLVNTVLNHMVYSEALYLRAHKEEPLVMQAVISAVLITVSTVIFGKYFGANAVVIAVSVQGVLFALPYATYIFIRRRRIWRALAEPIAVPDHAG